MTRRLLFLLFALAALSISAQTEIGSQPLSGQGVDTQKTNIGHQLQADSMRFHTDMMQPYIAAPTNPSVQSYTNLTKQGGVGIPLWKGAYVGFSGMTEHKPGLMTTEMGSATFYQQLGRWQFTVSGMANKYWMPWQRSLFSQYGVGGTVAYMLSDAVSLHAFGYYYANQMLVGPAMQSYMNSTTYGGYADIRFSNTFGANLGAKRYVDPMTGQWTTVPIVNPYIKIGGGKLEIPLGDLLKHFVWDRNDRSRQQQWLDRNDMNNRLNNLNNGFAPSSRPVVPPPAPVRPPKPR
jgi:hypothetical protein